MKSTRSSLRLSKPGFLVAAMCVGGLRCSAQAAFKALDLYTLTVPSGYSMVQPASAAGGLAVGTALSPAGIHAMVWNGSGPGVDLNPGAGIAFSYAVAADGIHEVGNGFDIASNQDHAFLWSGSPSTAVDLGPGDAFGVGGMQQVGSLNGAQALLWNGTPTPVSLGRGLVRATDGTHQVGDSGFAYMWSGTAESGRSLPETDGTISSTALGVGGNEQVGEAQTIGANMIGGPFHAILWHEPSVPAVDLNPDRLGMLYSTAFGTNGSEQVGHGTQTNGVPIWHALVWSETAASAVDLHALLPATFTSSTAYSIDSAGDIFGIAQDSSGNYHAVEWVPEPSALSLLTVGAAVMLRRRRA